MSNTVHTYSHHAKLLLRVPSLQGEHIPAAAHSRQRRIAALPVLGCAVLFSDPRVGRRDPPEPPPLDPSAKALLASWGSVLEEARTTEESPEEYERIKAAAARANKFKRRR
jgi:hypothetical protein